MNRKNEITGKEGKLLPSFQLLLADSTTILDTKNIPADKPIVLFLFGPHCPYSRVQMQDIIDNMNQLKDIQLYVFTPYPFSQMKLFYEEFHLKNFKNVTAGVDKDNFFGNYIGAKGVPYIAIYDKQKKLRTAHLGKTNVIQEIAED